MQTLFFQTASTIDEAKKEYKELYITNCSNAEVMADINAQFTAFKTAHTGYSLPNPPAQPTEPKTATNETQEEEHTEIEWKAKNAAIVEGCTVEICGNWIWVKCDRDNTPAHEYLKANRFRFSGSKKAWYFTNQPFKKRRGSKTLPQIKVKYGAEPIQAEML